MLWYKFSFQVPAGIQHEYGSAAEIFHLKDLEKYKKETVTPMEPTRFIKPHTHYDHDTRNLIDHRFPCFGRCCQPGCGEKVACDIARLQEH